MNKETLECKLMQVIGQYGIIKCIERQLFGTKMKPGRKYTIYDVCLDRGDGDIVYSCEKIIDARKWAREN